MTAEQLEAACGEARTLGLRTLVHAYGADAIIAAVRAGCNQVEHGTFASDEALRLMAERGTSFDPNIGPGAPELPGQQAALPRHRQLHGARLRVHGGDAPARDRDVPAGLEGAGLKMVHGTDASAGAHGRNAEEAIGRVQADSRRPPPWPA